MMVAYSFQRRFVNPIRVGLGLEQLPTFPLAAGPKLHTLRARRKRGHARPGDELQLYFGMRTRGCMLIGRSLCLGTEPLEIVVVDGGEPRLEGLERFGSPDEFAVSDGFENFVAFRDYWLNEHKIGDSFDGEIVYWKPIDGSADECRE
jgi:hypothetical protein